MKTKVVLDLLFLLGSMLGLGILLLYTVAQGVSTAWANMCFGAVGFVSLSVGAMPSLARELGKEMEGLDRAVQGPNG